MVLLMAGLPISASRSQEATQPTDDELAIRTLLDKYVTAFQSADADLMESLFWLDDERFIEIEDHIPVPFGRETFLEIMDWIRENQEPGGTMAFRNTRIFVLSPVVATSVSVQEIGTGEETSTSRALLVYLKNDGEWRILQGHFSSVPK
jgi:uncharacterized protein (TIGR02246 family)